MKVEDAYSNIERIITYGFLSVRISINGHDLLIKDISDKEMHQMSFFCSDKDIRKTNFFSLAYCTIAIDGVNLIEYRHENLAEIVKFYKKSPALVVFRIVDALNELNQAYIDSLEFLEGFCYSPRSRYLWSVMDPYDRATYTGFKGIDAIGISSVVESWIHINKKLDEEQEYGRELNLTLLVVSASNYKSAKVLSKNYETHTQELKELRDEIFKYGVDRERVNENNKKREMWTTPLSSREDLVKELYRQMTGDKDKHDLYIDQWLENQKQKADNIKKSVDDRQKAYREKIAAADLDLLEPSKPISEFELQRALEQKKQVRPDSPFMEDKEGTGMKERVLRKISTKIIQPEIKDLING